MQYVTYLSTVHHVTQETQGDVAHAMVRTVQVLSDELPHVLLHIIPHSIRPEAMGRSLHAPMPGVLHVSTDHQPRL